MRPSQEYAGIEPFSPFEGLDEYPFFEPNGLPYPAIEATEAHHMPITHTINFDRQTWVPFPAPAASANTLPFLENQTPSDAPPPDTAEASPIIFGSSGPNNIFAPCAICGKTQTKESLAKKHAYQHTKPFACGHPGCIRLEGFATRLDVERHRKSVHGLPSQDGDRSWYQCRIKGCASEGRIWARSDHFRNHVKAKHSEYDEAALVLASVVKDRAEAVFE